MIRPHHTLFRRTAPFALALAVAILPGAQINGQSLKEGLVAYWPMEEVQGDKTPDKVSGYDLTLNNLTAADLVAGKAGKCFSFANAKQSLLSRVHGANDELPANKNAAFTVAFWAKIPSGQTDLRLFSEAFTPNNNNPLFNIGTDSTGGSGAVDFYIRQTGWTDVNHIKSTGEPFDDTWHYLTFVQQTDGARALYIDGALDPLEIPPKPEGTWQLNDTTIGGILRASASHWVTGLIDEVAIWKRALSEAEINKIKTDGVPAVFVKQAPLELRTFTADFPAVATGDKVVLRWEGSKDATYNLTPAIGDVTGTTQFGAGSKEVTVTAPTTYTLTITRGSESLSKQVEVKTVAGVTPNWHLIDTFSFLNAGNLSGQSFWLGAEGIFNVVDFEGNRAITYEDGNDLTAAKLNSFTIAEGQKGTLTFRLYVKPPVPDEPITAIAVHIGLTERSIRFNGDFAQNVGPYLRLDRVADGTTLDLQARNGVATGFYEGQFTDAIQPGAWYRLWLDVENRPFDVVEGVQNGGDLYSAYLQKEGEATRTTLFENYLADRDAVTIDPALGAPTKDLTHVFVTTIGGSQPVNEVLFDEFFISTGAYNSTVPLSAVVGPTEISVRTSYDTAARKLTLTWSSPNGVTYTVEKRGALTGAWTTAATGHPAGGASGGLVSYTDDAAAADAAFYRVVYLP